MLDDMKALWLTSWYPNEINKTNGDFIQRQAEAVSMFCKVDVIHVEAVTKNQVKENIKRHSNTRGNLTETIILYRNTFRFKFLSFTRYQKLFKKQIKQYIRSNGLPDVVHVHVAMKAGIIALWMKKKYSIPFVITEHWTMYSDNALNNYERKNSVFKFFIKKIFRNASAVLPVSNNLGELISKKVTLVNYEVVYNVVNTDFFNQKNVKQHDVFTFVHVSSLNYQKNPEIIIEASNDFFQSHPDSKLFMIGPDEKHVQAKYASSKNITFLGELTYKQVSEFMQSSNAFVLFSRYENMPCVVLEALCCGLPVITSNVGGLSEIIDEQNGILVNAYDKPALINAITKLYHNYHQYDRRMISENAIKKFSYQTIGKQISNIYEEVITAK